MNVKFLGRFSQKRTPSRKACDREAMPSMFSKKCQPRCWQMCSPPLTAPPGEVNATDAIVTYSFYQYHNKNIKFLENYSEFFKTFPSVIY